MTKLVTMASLWDILAPPDSQCCHAPLNHTPSSLTALSAIPDKGIKRKDLRAGVLFRGLDCGTGTIVHLIQICSGLPGRVQRACHQKVNCFYIIKTKKKDIQQIVKMLLRSGNVNIQTSLDRTPQVDFACSAICCISKPA